jgi:hypothetical protein
VLRLGDCANVRPLAAVSRDHTVEISTFKSELNADGRFECTYMPRAAVVECGRRVCPYLHAP